MLTLRHSVKESDLQSVAEAVHLALSLISDAMFSEDLHQAYLLRRMLAIEDELKPAMMILAPFMPYPIGESKPLERPENSAALDKLGAALVGLPEDEDCPSGEDERGYLDGGDEQSYSARHA